MTHSRTRFRPCIDLHAGLVKQIVGGSLSDAAPDALRTNFVASESAADFARLYRENGLHGAHVIKLGHRNDAAAREALAAWPGGLQIGGGITDANALEWLEAGAAKVIVTSHLFPGCMFSRERLAALSRIVGRDRLVVDVSCRRQGDKWIVAMNKWQDLTDMEVNKESLDLLTEYCRLVKRHRLRRLLTHFSEFLIHAADVEGLCQGIDEALVQTLGAWVTIPTTYAGGAKSLDDMDLVQRLSNGNVDLTYGSALDIFGGSLVKFADLVKRDRRSVDDAL